MRKQEGFRQWNEDVIDGIAFKAEACGSYELGCCYNRYDTKITADKPFTQAQAEQFVRNEKIGYGQSHGFANDTKFPCTEAIYVDTVDSSD